MRKHHRLILLTLLSVLSALAYQCPAVKAQHKSAYRQAPILIGPMPTPEDTAKEAAFWRPIYTEVQQSQRLLEQNDLRGSQQAAEEALRMAGSRKGGLADELAPVYLRSRQYKRAVALFGPHPDLGRNLSLNEAIALVKTHRLADARKCWRESQMLFSHKDFKPYLTDSTDSRAFEATVFLCRGIADVDQNHPTNGIWALHHAVQLIPNNPLALWYYAEALANAGRSGEARRFFQSAIMRDHGLVARRAREGLARLDHAEGR